MATKADFSSRWLRLFTSIWDQTHPICLSIRVFFFSVFYAFGIFFFHHPPEKVLLPVNYLWLRKQTNKRIARQIPWARKARATRTMPDSVLSELTSQIMVNHTSCVITRYRFFFFPLSISLTLSLFLVEGVKIVSLPLIYTLNNYNRFVVYNVRISLIYVSANLNRTEARKCHLSEY